VAGEETEAVRWAHELRFSVPEERRVETAQMEQEKAIYRDRQGALRTLYRAFRRLAPAVSEDRLQAAIEGDAVHGRIPLAFPSAEAYAEFRSGLEEIFKAEDVTDATVQVIGSAINGWRANPRKPHGAWAPGSDLDLAVFSAQALAQARRIDVPVNDAIILNNEYVILMNDPRSKRFDRNGFYDTGLGARLLDFAEGWTHRLNSEVDFKLNLRAEPFRGGVTVIRPVRS
jgi:hypothetical protein